MQDHILIVDDDRQITSFLERFLKRHGYRTATAGTAAQMAAIMARTDFDLIVLDLILPDADGFEVAREIRGRTRIPIIMLTARDDIYDRVVGLELGADDYVTKPYEPRELLARIRSVMRRAHPPETNENSALPHARQLTFGGLTLDLVGRRLIRLGNGESISLTSTEYALLRALSSCAGEVLTRPRILETLYGNATMITDRAIDAHIARLRRKIDLPGSGESLIRTVHGEGYLMAAEVEAI